MIDLRILRENPEKIRENLEERNMMDFPFDELLNLDRERREILSVTQKLEADRNRISVEVSKLKSQGKDASGLISSMSASSEEIARNNKNISEVEAKFYDLATRVPNFVDKEVPKGKDDSANRVIAKWGEISQKQKRLDHIDIANLFGLIDIERAAKTSGARFYFLRRDLARLNFALISFGLDFLKQRGFTLIQPPYMLNREAMGGTIIFSDFQDVIYKIENEDLYLIGTSEHALVSMHMKEVLDRTLLPLRYAGISPCFRKEAGAHGRDTKGIFRVHQFEKVEQVVFCEPEESENEHHELLSNAQDFIRVLGFPHRTVLLSSGDMGKVVAKTFDIEAWIPSQQKYREIISCSNCTDYQARSLGIKYRPQAHERSEFVHTLNSTLVATERTLVALIENYYDDSKNVIRIPGPLQRYMNDQTEILPSQTA